MDVLRELRKLRDKLLVAIKHAPTVPENAVEIRKCRSLVEKIEDSISIEGLRDAQETEGAEAPRRPYRRRRPRKADIDWRNREMRDEADASSEKTEWQMPPARFAGLGSLVNAHGLGPLNFRGID